MAKAPRRTYREMFLDAIRALPGGADGFVSSAHIKDKLNWDEEKYSRIRIQLRDDGLILTKVGGPGGMVALAGANEVRPLRMFVSYSHADEPLKNKLIQHLAPLRRNGLIEEWHDRKLKGGEDWEGRIEQKLNDSDIILILVSVDFLDSKYCYDIELEAPPDWSRT